MARVFSAEQIAILRDIVSKSSTRVGTALGCSISDVQTFLDNLHSLYEPEKQRGPLQNQTYAISYIPGTVASRQPLTPKLIITNCSAENRILQVNSRLGLVKAEVADMNAVSLMACQDRSEAQKSFEVVIYGLKYWHYLCGRLIADGNFQEPDRIIPPGPSWSRPFSELRASIDDHMGIKIDAEAGLRYWAKKDERILLAGPDGTEYIFHHSLFEWLNMYISDRITVTAEPSGMGQNKADIIVNTDVGGNIIEIKWLGTNESATTCRAEHISFGLEQVKQYLERDTNMVSGHVVVYDARTEAEHKSERKWNPIHKHPSCADPIILFLENESTSKAAKRVVRAAKKHP